MKEDIPVLGFKENFKRSLGRCYSARGIAGIVMGVASVFILGFLVNYYGAQITQLIGVELPLLSILILSIPGLTLSTAERMSATKKNKLDTTSTRDLMGTFTGALVGTAIAMAIVLLSVVACYYLFRGEMNWGIMRSLPVAIVFGAIICGLTLFFNNYTSHPGLLSTLVAFFIVPGLMFILGPQLGMVDLNTMANIVPVMDLVAMPGSNGFGGFTLLTLLSLYKGVPALNVEYISSIVLCLGWAMLMLALAAIANSRRQ